MPITPKRLGQVVLGPANTTIYTAPSGVTGIIRTITICNTDPANTHTFSLFAIPSGGSAGAETQLYKDYGIAPSAVASTGATVVQTAIRIIPPGGSLRGRADAGAVLTVTVDGAEAT